MSSNANGALNEHFYKRLNIADTTTSIAELRELAKDIDWQIRECVAKNRNTPPAVLIELSTDVDVPVRHRVGNNPYTPREVLVTLARATEWKVRLGVAGNKAISIELLRELIKDEDSFVREEAFENPNCPMGLKVEYILSS